MAAPSDRAAHPLNTWLKGEAAVCIERTTLQGIHVRPSGQGKLVRMEIQGEGCLELRLEQDAADHLARLLLASNPKAGQ